MHLDDLYPGWDGLEAGVALLTEHVLAPLARGEQAAYPRWDWMRARPGRTVTVDAGPMLVVEGCGALVPPAAAFAAVRVWLDAPDEVRKERALSRDGETYAPHWERWAAQEDAVYAAARPARHRASCCARCRVNLDALRPDLARGVRRLRDRWVLIVQIGVAVLVAWLVAKTSSAHPTPFFAPVTAILCLGLTYGQRLRRIAEVTIGVAIGVLVGDLVVARARHRRLADGLVVVIAMSIAVVLSSGQLLVIQAGVQSVFIVALVADQSAAFSRWLDALVGGVVALVIGAIAPTSPVRRPRAEAARTVRDVAVDAAGRRRRPAPPRPGAAPRRR